VTFRRPFVLDGFAEELPAGAYDVETDEELLEDMSFPAYRRILTVIHLHARADRPGYTQSLTIDPNELDAALERDRIPKSPPIGQSIHEEIPTRVTKPRQEKTDRLAVDRAENEGMIVHPEQTITPRHEQEVAQ
jgi:hypothetical protein